MTQESLKITKDFKISREIYDKSNPEKLNFKAPKGLSKELIIQISKDKNEPDWMLQKRLSALEEFQKMKLPNWGPDLSNLNLDEIHYYLRPSAKQNSISWDDVPTEIKETFDKLGIPEAEKNALAGVGAQYESEVVYHKLKKELEDKGVIFLDCSLALQKYPEIFKEYFMTTCVPVSLHKFSALHAAVWSGGTFIYIPKNVELNEPLQAYFRMNAKSAGQFEHTLIILDEGAEAHYIEGCSAPQYSKNSIHAGCVEIFVKRGAKMRYSSIENWSKNTYNLNTKRAVVEDDAKIEWVNGNMGSGVTMLYPASILLGKNSVSESIGIAFANKNQDQDTGSKAIHIGENSKSFIESKSICINGGKVTYRGQVSITKPAKKSKSHVNCDSLIFDNSSVSNTYPFMDLKTKDAEITHEAKVGRIESKQLFYLMSRGLSEKEATNLIVSGFIEGVTKLLPLEYAVELNRLIELEMEGSL